AFPTAQIRDGAPDFSFSGIKTAVSLHVRRAGPLGAAEVADVAASFQAAVVKALVRKTVRAANALSVHRIVLTGGVAAHTAQRAPARPTRPAGSLTSPPASRAPTTRRGWRQQGTPAWGRASGQRSP